MVTKRVDQNQYDWMVQPERGNLIRTTGYKY